MDSQIGVSYTLYVLSHCSIFGVGHYMLRSAIDNYVGGLVLALLQVWNILVLILVLLQNHMGEGCLQVSVLLHIHFPAKFQQPIKFLGGRSSISSSVGTCVGGPLFWKFLQPSFSKTPPCPTFVIDLLLLVVPWINGDWILSCYFWILIMMMP